ncbi:MAG: aminotransferase class V-fold PLP-dependent enzyme [Spirulina sp. SIO3F2]|nr:aminotransferase class V-fold PLP-dependent enzyme [Spirulina sp. SIO3F2]
MFNAADYSDLLHQLETFFAQSTPSHPVSQPLDPAQLRDRLPLNLPAEGKPLADLKIETAAYLHHAVKTAHPSYFNQLWGGVNGACLMGELLTSATNTSMYTYEVAPVATLIEQALITKLGELIGFTHPDGQFTTGGSNGNLMAMAIARHRAMPTLKQDGMLNAPPLIAFVSADSHYSFAKAAHLLGLGTNQLWAVPTDAQGKLNVAELESLITKAHSLGAQPFFVAGTAGTTVRGAYDPLTEIAAVAQREGLWFHVDGAWGASVLLSPKHRELMRGVELADSVVWDAHKMMGMTLMCSVLLVKQRGQLLNTFSTQGTDYIFHADESEPVDLGPSTMHCGRRVDAVKLWLAWHHLGDRGWAALINHYFELAAYAECLIRNQPYLELVTPRESLNLCFRVLPQSPDQDANQLTLRVRQVLLQKGLAMVNYARIGKHIIFRLVICNNQTQCTDLDRLFEQIGAIAHHLQAEFPQEKT